MASALPSTVDNITTVITNEVSRDDLKLLITEEGAWKAFVEEAAELSSEEEADLRDALEKHLAQEPTDENDESEKKKQKENFQKEFPELKRKLEENIRKLRALADHIDEVHRGCTISNVVSGSTSIAATIAGLVLAPFTGGASLMIAAAGLGGAAAATGVTTTIVEESIKGVDESEARHLVGASMEILKRIFETMPLIIFKVRGNCIKLFCAWKIVRKYMRVIKTAGTSTRELSRTANLYRVFSMTRAAKIMRGVGAGLMLGFDVYNLVTDSMDLHSGAQTELAGEIRDMANNLEEKLREFEQLYKDLQSDQPQ
ncbi:apolipoprotein L3-like [Chionomys nivalis]|uniref:apolipoprotein L3-like n=1 Tax=Chionomys nivalis TaxID=269649 RepID=UPI0025944515|nr:apolipoprotein L3-like [Chionomys nivalis]